MHRIRKDTRGIGNIGYLSGKLGGWKTGAGGDFLLMPFPIILIFFFGRARDLTMLLRLVSNSWAQAILLLPAPEWMGLQVYATLPGFLTVLNN